ncbi:MAG: hypothetical protein WD847_02675 [Pirellulales bacterium]
MSGKACEGNQEGPDCSADDLALERLLRACADSFPDPARDPDTTAKRVADIIRRLEQYEQKRSSGPAPIPDEARRIADIVRRAEERTQQQGTRDARKIHGGRRLVD